MNLTLQQLSYLVAVDTFRSFVGAAKHCNVSQPALSMQIQKLEEALGVTVFDRSRQPILPTEIGKEIIRQARLVLRESARMQDVLDVARGELRGEFRLGVIPTVAPYLLPLFLRSFSRAYPDVTLVIEELQTRQIIQRIRHDMLDAAILATPLGIDAITEHPLYYEPFVGYVSKSHMLHKRRKIGVLDLHLPDIWLLKDGHCFREQILHICGMDRTQAIGEKKMVFEGGTLETLKKLVEQDFGITMLPYLAAMELRGREEGKLLREFTEPVPRREISIVYERSGLKTQVIEELARVITASVPRKLLKGKEEAVMVPLGKG